MYWETRVSITSQPAITTSTVVKHVEQDQQQRDAVDAEVVVDVEGLDPRREFDELHAVARRNRTGIERQRHQKPAPRRPARASARAGVAVGAGGKHRDAGDDRHPDDRTQQAQRPLTCASASREPEREQHEHADDHRERVVVDEAGLELRAIWRGPAHHTRRAVDEKAVDDGHVADLPQSAPEQARAAGEEPVVEAVEIILVLEQRIERPEGAAQLRRQVGALQIQETGASRCRRSPARTARLPSAWAIIATTP